MLAVESFFVSFVTVGEGWHNYHHAFPWDYRAAEYGTSFSFTTFMIDILAWFGLAYDLRTTPDHMVHSRALRSGDGSHSKYNNEDVPPPNEADLDINGNLTTVKHKHEIEDKSAWLFGDENNNNDEVKIEKTIQNAVSSGKIKDKNFTNGTLSNKADEKDKVRKIRSTTSSKAKERIVTNGSLSNAKVAEERDKDK